MRHIAKCLPKQGAYSWTVPTFLCPILQNGSARSAINYFAPRAKKAQCRKLHVEVNKISGAPPIVAGVTATGLPWTCPGCGAYTQAQKPEEAGFYSSTRKPVKAFRAYNRRLAGIDDYVEKASAPSEEEATGTEEQAGDNEAIESGQVEQDQTRDEKLAREEPKKHKGPPSPPICDRCHNLHYHNQGMSIEHPTIQAIQDMLADSPHKHNHVYHVLDAADFPLSLVPRLQERLSLSPQRAMNRRSKHSQHQRGRKADMSFIITRSDLLAPRKEQVDHMMPYLTEVLREALGAAGEGVRLGNVRCVSSFRGWWTRQVKEEVWERGGGQWMVGKVNVGKSQLLENIYPKNRVQDAKTLSLHVDSKQRSRESNTAQMFGSNESPKGDGSDLAMDTSSLLPPMPEETAFPVLPMVSHLPGTTASPIRLPFGRGKGELIDLPGLPRGNLENHVQDEHKGTLVMRSRKKAPQLSIKPGQSLVVSNLLRITPTTSDLVFLACPFLDVDCHVTSTEKAKAIMAQENTTAVEGIAKLGVGELVKSAGTYQLEWDVTKARSGPLTRHDAVAIKSERLPFVVFSTDILIEGVGWIELAAQVRKSALGNKEKCGPDQKDDETAEEREVQEEGVGQEGPQKKITQGSSSSMIGYPEVEIFSPNGEHVGSRMPLGAWMIGGHRRKPKSQRTQRPRPSMKGMKKAMKKEIRILREKERQGSM